MSHVWVKIRDTHPAYWKCVKCELTYMLKAKPDDDYVHTTYITNIRMSCDDLVIENIARDIHDS